MDESALDLVFAALASAERRRMLDILQAEPGLSVATLSSRFAMSAVGVLKHVGVLERAGLIVSRREGRERRLYFNLMPIQLVYDRWSDRYSSFWAGRLADLKHRLEAGAARAPSAGAENKGKDRNHARQRSA